MPKKGQKVLVTGASGFLGGALARALADDGAQVRALVRDRARAGYITDYPGIELVDGDLEDELSLNKAVRDCARVYHVAAALGGPPELQAKVNVEGTRRLTLQAARAGVGRMVLVSSIAIYGFEGLPLRVTEDTAPSPSRYAYTLTKRAGENALRLVAAETGLAYSIVRPGMIYGPRSHPWTVQMSQLASRLPFVLFIGDGRGHISPIHVDDVVSMCMAAGEHPAAVGQAFNCAADDGVPWRDFLTAYARHAGRSGRWLGIPPALVRLLLPLIKPFAPAGSLLQDMPAALNHFLRPVVYPTDKARQMLGWRPRWDIEQGLANAAAWLNAQATPPAR